MLPVGTPLDKADAPFITRDGAPFSIDEGIDFFVERETLTVSGRGFSVAFRDFRGAFGGGGTSDFTDAKRRNTRL